VGDSWIVDNLNAALNTWNGKLAEIWQLLTESPQTFRGGQVWSVMVGIHGALQAIGYGLLVLFFAIGVVKTCGSFVEVKRPEHALKLFIRFALAKAAVTYGLELMQAVFSIVQGTVPHELTFTYTGGTVSALTCTCYETGLCKHGAALLLQLRETVDFLREEKIERAGVFPFSPEEGTKAATMEHVPMEEAQRRTELLVDVQSDIIDEYNESVLGDVREVLCEGWSEEAQSFVGRSYAESVDIDGKIYFSAERDIMAGEFVNVRLTGTMDGELTGEAVE